VAIVWRGTPEQRGMPIPESSRLFPVGTALWEEGFEVEPVVYCEEASTEIRVQLGAVNGALVWVDPLTDGRTRTDLDATLREVAARGVWVGAHPDTILKMGTKRVLYETRQLGWGGDTGLYRDAAELRRFFPAKLAACGVRVLKRHRGNGGQGVWKVTALDASNVLLQEATDRDGSARETSLESFLAGCESYFEGGGSLIDQSFQPRIVEGMVRCYMCGGELVGFGRQYPLGHGDSADARNTFGLPAAKTMLEPSVQEFARLRQRLEREWTPAMQRLLGIADVALPALWDADFLFGPRDEKGRDTFVLCEINCSCVTPFPPGAPAKIAGLAARRLKS
jgi:hypothetical protein